MKQYKYLTGLICLSVLMAVIANTIAGKITHIGFLTLSAGSLCIPITYVIGDTLTEVYGYKQARRAMWMVIIASVITAVFYQLALLLPTATGSPDNAAFETVLGLAPRIAAGALAALFVGQFVNDFVLAKMKIMTKGKYLWSRTIGSTVAGQAVDSTLFYTIALYSVIPNSLLVKSIASAWFAKVVIEVLITPITYAVVRKLKKVEGIDTYDTKTDFNPFKVSLSEKQY
jgi:queuosine precursor transporter